MKTSRTILTMILCLSAVSVGCRDANTDQSVKTTPALAGPYLGMEPPGNVPKLFAPGIVSGIYNEHSGAVFTPDGSELFWSTVINEGRTPRVVLVLHMKQVGDSWTHPEIAPFNIGSYTHINSVSADGNRLYFFSGEEDGPAVAWVVESEEDGWGDPHPLRLNTLDNPGTVVNEVHEARSGTLYMSGPLPSMPGGRGIVRSRFKKGRYQEYESLGPDINLPHSDRFPNHSPTVDPDEEFVIFVSTRPGGYSEQDLYISYRQNDDTWGPAINLGTEINGFGTRSSWPQLSPDGKYLFFVSTVMSYQDIDERRYSYGEMEQIQRSEMNGWANIYWVDTSFVERLKPKRPNS